MKSRRSVAWLTALLVAILAAWGGVAYLGRQQPAGDCAGPVTLRIAAAPAIAAAVTGVATRRPDPCYRVEVAARESAAVAEHQSDAHVWLPESTFWLRRARSLGAFEAPDRGTPVASSPVVVALAEQLARRLGWPARKVTWSRLFGGDGVPVGLPDPASDPLGLATVLAVRTLTAREKSPQAANVAALRRISPNTVTRAADLYRSAAKKAFVTSEQALRQHGGQKLVEAAPDIDVPALDFPYAVLPAAPEAERQAAAKFLLTLLAPDGQHAFQAAGFRGPAAAALPGDDDLVAALTAWTGVHLSARMLGVLDVSGSMEQRVGNQTRLSATVTAIQQGVGLMLGTSEVGFWTFSTELDGDRDYRVLMPPAPLSEQRQRLVTALGQVRAKPRGGTGLYDTTLAAYREARRNWTAGRINVVVILTDGENEDDRSITKADLKKELARLADPRRPLPIIYVGIGDGVSQIELTEISKITGGRAFLSKNPSGIRQIFFAALAELSCQPPACSR
ncbi:substrate-binding domain-containing protein [Actinomycetes bacterium KLBMP 9797]